MLFFPSNDNVKPLVRASFQLLIYFIKLSKIPLLSCLFTLPIYWILLPKTNFHKALFLWAHSIWSPIDLDSSPALGCGLVNSCLWSINVLICKVGIIRGLHVVIKIGSLPSLKFTKYSKNTSSILFCLSSVCKWLHIFS